MDDQEMYEAIRSLPPGPALVIILRHGLSGDPPMNMPEIARLMEVSVATVSLWYKRAKRKIRTIFVGSPPVSRIVPYRFLVYQRVREYRERRAEGKVQTLDRKLRSSDLPTWRVWEADMMEEVQQAAAEGEMVALDAVMDYLKTRTLRRRGKRDAA